MGKKLLWHLEAKFSHRLLAFQLQKFQALLGVVECIFAREEAFLKSIYQSFERLKRVGKCSVLKQLVLHIGDRIVEATHFTHIFDFNPHFILFLFQTNLNACTKSQ